MPKNKNNAWHIYISFVTELRRRIIATVSFSIPQRIVVQKHSNASVKTHESLKHTLSYQKLNKSAGSCVLSLHGYLWL